MNNLKELEEKFESVNILVICENPNMFNAFCQEKLNQFNERGEWQGYVFYYFDSSDSLRGLKFDNYIKIGDLSKKTIDWAFIYGSIR